VATDQRRCAPGTNPTRHGQGRSGHPGAQPSRVGRGIRRPDHTPFPDAGYHRRTSSPTHHACHPTRASPATPPLHQRLGGQQPGRRATRGPQAQDSFV
jgi:hypothetical protein